MQFIPITLFLFFYSSCNQSPVKETKPIQKEDEPSFESGLTDEDIDKIYEEAYRNIDYKKCTKELIEERSKEVREKYREEINKVLEIDDFSEYWSEAKPKIALDLAGGGTCLLGWTGSELIEVVDDQLRILNERIERFLQRIPNDPYLYPYSVSGTRLCNSNSFQRSLSYDMDSSILINLLKIYGISKTDSYPIKGCIQWFLEQN